MATRRAALTLIAGTLAHAAAPDLDALDVESFSEMTHVLSAATTALYAESFAEGFRRGIAFTRWLAERPAPASAALAA